MGEELILAARMEYFMTLVSSQLRPTSRMKMKPKFKVLLVDPPWDINQKGKYGAAAHYDTMTMQEILNMGEAIRAITADDCWLLVWMTNRVAFEYGKEILKAWGFAFRSDMTWFKCKRNGLGQPWRNSTEQLILASRGKPIYEFKGQSTELIAPVQDHSHKPEEQYAIIDRFLGDTVKDGEKGELFARRETHGWKIWGNEVDSDFSLQEFGYPVPSDFVESEDVNNCESESSEEDKQ